MSQIQQNNSLPGVWSDEAYVGSVCNLIELYTQQ